MVCKFGFKWVMDGRGQSLGDPGPADPVGLFLVAKFFRLEEAGHLFEEDTELFRLRLQGRDPEQLNIRPDEVRVFLENGHRLYDGHQIGVAFDLHEIAFLSAVGTFKIHDASPLF